MRRTPLSGYNQRTGIGRMTNNRSPPDTLVIENVVFVSFPTPANRWEYIDRLAIEGRQAVAALRATIERTRWLAQRTRALTTPDAVPVEALAQAISDSRQTLDNAASSRAHCIA